ncbi:hypothetical protein [Hymenobacter sp. BT491]|uniref:hypothetical protein n=1 Tax=Hymenobacter sp. BT491 TaxID=2766779 RepID=UPI001653683C|nr:hypothetical protein [Hymenobacter sp. BT491]MBC6992218.1 hypothetical protein [Hymenobacter sp. BT491]
MEQFSFDALTRRLGQTTSRRQALYAIAAASLTGVRAFMGIGCGSKQDNPSPAPARRRSGGHSPG